MFFPQVMQQSMEVMRNMPMFNNEQYRQVLDLYLSIQSWQYGLLLIAEIAIFAGALIMLWKLKPVGLHLYIVGQMALFCVQNFVIGGLMRSCSTIWRFANGRRKRSRWATPTAEKRIRRRRIEPQLTFFHLNNIEYE